MAVESPRGDAKSVGARVLIVEDDGIIATQLQSVLRNLQYDVVGAVVSGEEAIQKVDEVLPNLILMDIYLAGTLNGIETTTQINVSHNIPVIYLTAYSDDTLLQQAKIIEPYGYLIKPVQDRELHATIEMALYRHELETKLEQRNTQLQTAAEVSKSANTILDLEKLMNQTVNLIRERFGFYYVGLFLVQDAQQGEWAVLRAGTGEAGRQMLKAGYKLAVGGESMIGWSVANARARIAPDAEQDVVRAENPYLPETRSEMALPLVSRGRSIGALTVQSTKKDAFTEQDAAVLQTMADQLAIAIENARLYQAAQREIAERARAEEALQRRTHDLGERVKELDCLYNIPRLVQKPGSSLTEVLQGTVEIIPSAWQYPETTRAQIVLEGQESARTKDFQETTWMQASDIVVHGGRVGTVQVCYLEERPESDEGPFSKEERGLIDAIAERLGRVIERLRAEEALRRSEERYALAQRAANIGSWDWDVRTGDIHWSDQIAPLFGFERGEFGATYEAFLACVHPEDRQYVTDAIDASIEGGRDYAIEHRVVWPDGTVHWVLEAGDVLRDESGQATRMLGVVQDITERKQAEMAVQESEARFRGLLESAPDAIVITDGDGLIVLVTAQTEEMFGYAREELLGQSIEALLPRRFQDVHVRHRAGYYAQPRTRPMGIDLDLVARRKDGSEFPAEISLSPVKMENDILVASAIRDITELRRVEEQMRLQSSALESAANAIAITDRKGRITWVNPAFTKLTGYTLEEALGRNPRILKSGMHGPSFYRDLWKTVLAGRVWRDEIVNRRKDGSLYTEEMTITPVQDARGEITHFIAVKQDISERKRAEEELRRYADEQAALYAITSAASTFLDPDELLSTVLDVVLSVLDIDAGWVMLPGPTLDDLPRIVAWRDIPESFLAAEVASSLRNCLICAPLLAGADASSEPIPTIECPRLPAEILASANLHSHVGIPLRVGNQVLGILNVAWRAPHAYPEMDRTLLMAIGQQVGLALHNAQLYQAARQADRLQALNDISAAAVSSLDRDTVLGQILELACQALNAVDGSILLQDPGTEELVFALNRSGDSRISPGQRLASGQGIAGWVVQHNQSVRANDACRDSRFYDGVDALTGVETRSLLCAPLIHRNKITGAIEIINKRQGEFDDEDLSLLEAVSSIAAAAMENARLYDELRTLLREREEAQAQLLRTEKLSALGRLAASLAHEINNPLQSIIGCLGLAQEGMAEGEDVDRYLDVAYQEVRRVARTVGQMRDLYRPASEEKDPAEVNVLLEQVLELSRKRCQEIGVEVIWEPATDLPLLMLASDQIKQVFLNLLLNALEAMPHGGRLEVSTAYTDQPGGVRVVFTDSGEGVPPEVLPRIFEPFYSTKSEGTGLGLSTSHSVVERHGGYIEVDSQWEEGSTFTVWLPTPMASDQ